MAKKVNVVFSADMTKNLDRGGAWLAEFDVVYDYEGKPRVSGRNAFSNPSAAKRWLKEMVLEHTNKKSIKMVAGSDKDAKDKPINFSGTVVFKVEESAL